MLLLLLLLHCTRAARLQVVLSSKLHHHLWYKPSTCAVLSTYQLTQSPTVAAAVAVLHQYTLTRLLCSLGNVHFTTAAAPTKAAPSSCTYNRFTALQKPPVANGKAQGFGMAVTLSADASMIIAGVGGCFVTPGGKAPPCPNFPGGSAAAGGLPNKGDQQGSGGYKRRQPSFWLPDHLNMTGELLQDSTLRIIYFRCALAGLAS
jgi:hypothetical protein